MKTYRDIHTAYLGTLHDLYNKFDFRASPRGISIREILDYGFKVQFPSSEPIVTADVDRNAKIAAYTAKEVELYDSRSNRVEDFARASKFWEKIANPDGTINSAYGHLIWHKKSHGNPAFKDGQCVMPALRSADDMKTPWEWAKNSLIKDKDTRQAVMRFSLPEHFWSGNKDQVCTLHGNWLIRCDELHLSVVMRSNDAVLGLVYDLPWFCSLMDRMLEELKPTYPELTKGTYTHFVHSMHIYDRDEEIVKKMLGIAP